MRAPMHYRKGLPIHGQLIFTAGERGGNVFDRITTVRGNPRARHRDFQSRHCAGGFDALAAKYPGEVDRVLNGINIREIFLPGSRVVTTLAAPDLATPKFNH